jgi:hypothetical protein
MITLSGAALAAFLASGPALAEGPGAAPAPAHEGAPTTAARTRAEGGAKRPVERKAGAGKAAKGTPAPPPAPKEAPCEPVKPCPIE